MKLNCKVGDMAYVKAQGLGVTGTIGQIVECKRLVFNEFGDICWVLSKPICFFVYGKKFLAEIIPDQYLRPISNPGEDAIDETLLWLPVPDEVVA
jgi:hypothetical protein